VTDKLIIQRKDWTYSRSTALWVTEDERG